MWELLGDGGKLLGTDESNSSPEPTSRARRNEGSKLSSWFPATTILCGCGRVASQVLNSRTCSNFKYRGYHWVALTAPWFGQSVTVDTAIGFDWGQLILSYSHLLHVSAPGEVPRVDEYVSSWYGPFHVGRQWVRVAQTNDTDLQRQKYLGFWNNHIIKKSIICAKYLQNGLYICRFPKQGCSKSKLI